MRRWIEVDRCMVLSQLVDRMIGYVDKGAERCWWISGRVWSGDG